MTWLERMDGLHDHARAREGEETRRLALRWETTGKGMPGCFEALGLDLAFLSVSPPLGDPGLICALQVTVKLQVSVIRLAAQGSPPAVTLPQMQ